MSHWNHRLVRESEGIASCVTMCEVYYDNNNRPISYTSADCVSEEQDDDIVVKDITQYLEWMLEATKKPILISPNDFTGEFDND